MLDFQLERTIDLKKTNHFQLDFLTEWSSHLLVQKPVSGHLWFRKMPEFVQVLICSNYGHHQLQGRWITLRSPRGEDWDLCRVFVPLYPIARETLWGNACSRPVVCAHQVLHACETLAPAKNPEETHPTVHTAHCQMLRMDPWFIYTQANAHWWRLTLCS